MGTTQIETIPERDRKLEDARDQSANHIQDRESEPEGLGSADESVGDYPIDAVLIRTEHRTVHDVLRRIKQGYIILAPDFQRDFIWEQAKQSRLIESVIMRIPLPVFYFAENNDGKTVVVDGVQRLYTFKHFIEDDLKLQLPDRPALHNKRFSELKPGIRNRIEDCNLTLYSIDSKVPDRARLDIFERVNGGVPLTRQQMRNSIYMGPGTKFLKNETDTSEFKKATGESLNKGKMTDREFVNRFCAFQLLGSDKYNQMDTFLADCLTKMNGMEATELKQLSDAFRLSLANNFLLFEKHAFRKHKPSQESRNPLNASLWDVMSTGLSHYDESHIKKHAESFKKAFYCLLEEPDFVEAISVGTSQTNRVRRRFELAHAKIREVLGDYTD